MQTQFLTHDRYFMFNGKGYPSDNIRPLPCVFAQCWLDQNRNYKNRNVLKKTFSKGQVYLPSLNSFHANLTTANDVINGFKNKCPFEG
jgi:hypothetical protein